MRGIRSCHNAPHDSGVVPVGGKRQARSRIVWSGYRALIGIRRELVGGGIEVKRPQDIAVRPYIKVIRQKNLWVSSGSGSLPSE